MVTRVNDMIWLFVQFSVPYIILLLTSIQDPGSVMKVESPPDDED